MTTTTTIAPVKTDIQVVTRQVTSVYYLSTGSCETPKVRFVVLMECQQTNESVAIDVLAPDLSSALKEIRSRHQFDRFAVEGLDHESTPF